MPALAQRTYPTATARPASEFLVDPARFRETFAADLPAERAAVMAAAQRPIAASGVLGPVREAGLEVPALMGGRRTGDKAAGADLVRSMAERAGADTVEVESSHLVMVSQPQAVADHIARAAEATSGRRVMPMVEVSPFASLRQVEAGDLSVGYAELGPGDGPAVLLLHGWPYDIHATRRWPRCSPTPGTG